MLNFILKHVHMREIVTFKIFIPFLFLFVCLTQGLTVQA